LIRHAVLLKWKPGTSEEAIQRWVDGCAELPDKIDLVRRYTLGRNVGTSREGMAKESIYSDNFDAAVTADFDSYADYQIYAEHPAHKAFIAECVRPILAERVGVQYDLDDVARFTPQGGLLER
jgi:cell division FtsZ-interacting protein ZapD